MDIKKIENLSSHVTKSTTKTCNISSMSSNTISKTVQKSLERTALKVALKQAKEAEKEAKKQANEAIKEAKKLEKAELKAREQELKKREKLAAKEAIQKERARIQRKQAKKDMKYEIKDKSISYMYRTAKEIHATYSTGGATIQQICETYIKMHGRINPYTLEEADEKYDINAAIRGFVYETSPSSEQSWFRYGMKKVREQVAPWIFANMELATVNDDFGWKVSTPELAAARRQFKGKWILIVEGSNAYYDWNEERYGPLPTEETIEEAAQDRKVGVRGRRRVTDVEA
jgi:hypothetical protein